MFGEGYTVGRSRNNSSESMNTAKSMPDLSNPERVQQVPRPGSADLLSSENYEPTPDILDFYPSSMSKPEYLTIPIVKGNMGFGFTIADSAYGQKVKKILDRSRCKNLIEGDILVDINNINVKGMSHTEVVQVLKDCQQSMEAIIMVQRGGLGSPSKSRGPRKDPVSPKKASSVSAGLYRSKTPTADMYSSQQKEVIPNRPKTPLVDTRNRPKTPNVMGSTEMDPSDNRLMAEVQEYQPPFTSTSQIPYPGAFSYTGARTDAYNPKINSMSSQMNQMTIDANNYENYNNEMSRMGGHPEYPSYRSDNQSNPPHPHPHQGLSYNNLHDNYYPPPHNNPDQYDYEGKRNVAKTPTMEYNSSGYPQYSYYMNNGGNNNVNNSNYLNNNNHNVSADRDCGYGYVPYPKDGYDVPRQDSGYSSQAQIPPAKNPYPPNYGQNSSAGYNNAPNSYMSTSHEGSSYNMTNSISYNQNDSLGRRKESTSFEYEHPAPVSMPR